MRHPVKIFAAGAALTLLVPAPRAARAQAPHPTIFGASDNGILYAVYLDTQTGFQVFNTGFSGVNAFAYNAADNSVYYRSSSSTGAGLYSWVVGSNTQTLVSTTLPGRSANASVYDGAYWYIQEASDKLTRVELSTNGFGTTTTYANFDGTSASSFSFGDIAISSTGILYGQPSSGSFFSVDISGLKSGGSGSTANFTSSVNSGSLQLALDSSSGSDKLYGQNTTSGQWYQVDISNTGTAASPSANFGQRTTINGFVTTGLNDVTSVFTSSNLTALAAPEPPSAGLLLLGMTAAAGIRLKRRGAARRA